VRANSGDTNKTRHGFRDNQSSNYYLGNRNGGNLQGVLYSIVTPTNVANYGVVASAATITLPDLAEVVSVTGTTGVTSITAGLAGRRVTLVFAGALTVTEGSNLRLAGNFVTDGNSDSITLVSDGVDWIEASRSNN